MKAKLDPKVREKLDKEGSVAVRNKMPAIMAVTALGKKTPVDLGDGVTCTSRDVQQWLEELDATYADRLQSCPYARRCCPSSPELCAHAQLPLGRRRLGRFPSLVVGFDFSSGRF